MTAALNIIITIINWNSREGGLFKVCIYFFVMALFKYVGLIIVKETSRVYVSFASGILLLTICPFILKRYFIMDPIDAGILIDEYALIML